MNASVSRTTDDIFNPTPVQNAFIAHSLVDLLKQLSPAFKKSYDSLLKRRANKHPFERLPTPYQVNTWLTPSWQHTMDSVRKEECGSFFRSETVEPHSSIINGAMLL